MKKIKTLFDSKRLLVIKTLFAKKKSIPTSKILNFLIFCTGLLSYYFNYYLLTFYVVLHFTISLGQYLNKNFNQKVQNIHQDQITIRDHYLKDFKTLYYLILIIRVLTILFYFYFFSLDPKVMHDLSDLFYGVTYTFVIAGLIDMGISLYIIFYKNNPVIEVAANVCWQCSKGLVPLGALHMSCNVPFIAPNKVSNFYHIYSPLGRGYGVWSSGQLLQIDYLKTQLGGEFNYKKIIDSDNMVNPAKLQQYANGHKIGPTVLNSVAFPAQNLTNKK